MKRRSLLMLLPPLLGWSGRIWAQDPVRRSKALTRGRQAAEEGDEDPPKKRSARPKASASEDDGGKAGPIDEPPAGVLNEPDFEMRKYDISAYTALTPSSPSPQTAILDWIFRRTETGPWHGDKIAVLVANRSQIRAYNSKKILDQVTETIEQFTDAMADVLTVRVRFLAAADPQWRTSVITRLTPVGSGPQGQQIWSVADANIEAIIAQMTVWSGFKVLEDKNYSVLNGQTLRVESFFKKTYPGSVQREGAVGTGFQPKIDNLLENIVLRFSPLLSYDGDTLDAAIDLSTNLIRKFHPVKVLGPREIGSGEITLEVPEVSESRLNQAVKSWQLGNSLLISAGIQPGLLLDKSGWMNLKLPGTVPTTTEALCVINVTINNKKAALHQPERLNLATVARDQKHPGASADR